MDVWIAGWTVGLMGIEGWSKKVPDTPFSSYVCALCSTPSPPTIVNFQHIVRTPLAAEKATKTTPGIPQYVPNLG